SKFVGSLEIACKLHIDGNFEGEIVSENIVEIGTSGEVKSKIMAKKLVVSGKFVGDAECESIELTSGGEAEGKLTSASLTIDSESSFQGESIRKRPEDIKKADSKVVGIASEKNPFSETKVEKKS
ncbi:MAG: polymer-forming cytoskeletal protein, partial [Pseudomonadota bacterium]